MTDTQPQPEVTSKRERKVPKIECRKTQCNKNLHSFLNGPKQKKNREMLSSPLLNTKGLEEFEACWKPNQVEAVCPRACWNCGVVLVDWNRTHARDLSDLAYTFEALMFEYVRHEFWCKDIDQYAINNAKRRGRLRMPQYAEKRIIQSVGKAKNFNEGRQTKGEDDILFYAQHATGTCCRPCMEVWHGIPQGRDLTNEEIAFCVALLLGYVDIRLPDLNQHPQSVPGISRKKGTEETGEMLLKKESPGDQTVIEQLPLNLFV